MYAPAKLSRRKSPFLKFPIANPITRHYQLLQLAARYLNNLKKFANNFLVCTAIFPPIRSPQFPNPFLIRPNNFLSAKLRLLRVPVDTNLDDKAELALQNTR